MDGVAFKARISEFRDEFPLLPDNVEPRNVHWPIRKEWWMSRTTGEWPTKKRRRGSEEETVTDERWIRVGSLKEVKNIYDLGFWANLKDTFTNREQ